MHFLSIVTEKHKNVFTDIVDIGTLFIPLEIKCGHCWLSSLLLHGLLKSDELIAESRNEMKLKIGKFKQYITKQKILQTKTSVNAVT